MRSELRKSTRLAGLVLKSYCTTSDELVFTAGTPSEPRASTGQKRGAPKGCPP